MPECSNAPAQFIVQIARTVKCAAGKCIVHCCRPSNPRAYICELSASVPSVDGGGGVFSDAGEAQRAQAGTLGKAPGPEEKPDARLGCQATSFLRAGAWLPHPGWAVLWAGRREINLSVTSKSRVSERKTNVFGTHDQRFRHVKPTLSACTTNVSGTQN